MDLLYSYKLFLSTYYSEHTQKTYLSEVNCYLRFLKEYKGNINNIIIYNVTRSDIYNYVAYLSNKPKTTIQIKLKAIKNYYTFLDKKLATFLFEDIKLYTSNKKLPHYLSLQEINLLLGFYSGEKRDIIYLFLNLGIRLSEMAQIDFKNINYNENYFTIIQKGGIQRRVYYSDQVKQVLKKYNKFSYNRRQIQYFISYAMKKLNIKGSTHTLRHTFATLMYRKTQDILLVKELLGHKTIISTQVYTHITNEKLRQAFNSNPLANFGVGGEE